MEEVSTELTATSLQLLAINTLFEHLRAGAPASKDAPLMLLQRIIKLGGQAADDPLSVCSRELDDAQAEMLYYGLLG